MKKIYLTACLALSTIGAVNAQISEGGLPWSLSTGNNGQIVQKVSLAEPDYAAYQKEDAADEVLRIAKPYRVAAIVKTNIDISAAGSWTYLNNKRIWRLTVEVPNAKAISCHFNKFYLPKGASLFISNDNGNQVIGAYTEKNNNEYNVFSNEEVQGSIIHLELNLDASVDVANLDLAIDELYAYYRSADIVNKLYGNATTIKGAKPTGLSSPCQINANCPQGNDAGFQKSKKASIQIIEGNGLCSGTMINNTGNDGSNCKPLVLTASHCQQSNSRSDADYSTWKIRFNYQYVDCEGTTMESYKTLTGVNFRARSNYPSFTTPANALVTDFLLVETKDMPTTATDAYFSGWNRNTDLETNPIYNKFVGYHHPKGDPKKFSSSVGVDGSGQFNQSVVTNTHWNTFFNVGGTEEGSSGSGLFDINGLLVGDLSGGPDGSGECAPMGFSALYSKISAAWENTFDQTNFPQYAGAQSRLKDWLDPLNTGRTTMPTIKADCNDYWLGVKDVENALNKSINVYPNPVTNGVVYVQVNFTDLTDLEISVTDIVGRQEGVYKINKALKGTYDVDLKGLSNGMHIIKIASNGASVSRKIIINK